jgi:hypothetical protein
MPAEMLDLFPKIGLSGPLIRLTDASEFNPTRSRSLNPCMTEKMNMPGCNKSKQPFVKTIFRLQLSTHHLHHSSRTDAILCV